MSVKHKTRHGHGWLGWYIPLLLVELAGLITLLIHGKNIAILNPQGLVAHQQLGVMIQTVVVLLVVAVPTVLFLYFTAWKYRESNIAATHSPKAGSSTFVAWGMWFIPTVVMVLLTFVLWPTAHRLTPQSALASDKKPMTIQVISMRWKWVFLYPDQKIATVNFVQIPENTPVTFELTADDAPMSSFWIPNLGGQLYSMTGHVNKLNLMGESPGDYVGSSAELNGAGFTGMKFTTRVSSAAEFNDWANSVRQSSTALDTTAYANLIKPSENNQAAFYSTFDQSLYDTVVMKYMASHEGHTDHE